MTDDNTDSPLTVWQSIEVLAKTILGMRKELNLIKNIDSNQSITLEKGKELLNGIYEANFKLNKEISVATLPKIGYHMFDDELVVRNHIAREEVKIPRDFHYLKVIKSGHGGYKLTFCNALGNEFFEYKKYDPQYSSVTDEYKFMDLGSINKSHSLKSKEYVSHAPKFFAAEGPFEPGSQKHVIDLFELVRGGKGKKVGTLADEFGYFDDQNKLNYCDYHKSTKSNTYDPEKFSVKMINMDTSKIDKFYLVAEQGDIIIHPILENLDIF